MPRPEPLDLPEALAQVEHLWVEHDVLMALLAEPGISAQEVREGVASVGLVAPDELITWFGWHNGYDMLSRPTYLESEFMPPGWCLLSLDQAIEHYRMSQEIWASIADESYDGDISSWGWTPDLFPIAGSGSGSTIVISCAGEPSAPAQVTVISKEGRNEAFDLIPSLFEAINTLLRLAKAGEYRWNNPGWVGNQFALGDSPLF